MVRNEPDPSPRGRVHTVASLAVCLATLTMAALALSALARSQAPAGERPPSEARAGSRSESLLALRSSSVVPAPAPPEEPTLRSLCTRATTRLWGATPYEKAVAVSQHQWTAVMPAGQPGDLENVGDRPRIVLLVDVDDPLAAISATPLIHLPLDAAMLFVDRDGIPPVTLEELRRIRPVMGRSDRVEVLVIGEGAANPPVLKTLNELELSFEVLAAESVSELANRIDAWYGNRQNPDLGIATLGPDAAGGGIGIYDVLIGSTAAWKFMLPATHWAAHRPSGLLWVTKESVPGATIEALKRRRGQAKMYVFGGPEEVSAAVVRRLADYGPVMRVYGGDGANTGNAAREGPARAALAFVRMWDPVGMVGWNIDGQGRDLAGHEFTLVNIDDWQGAVVSAALSRAGYAAPLLFARSPEVLPGELERFLLQIRPANGPFGGEGTRNMARHNMTWVIGDYRDVSWPLQARVDRLTSRRE